MSPRCGILTVSDRAYRGAYEDKTGPALAEALKAKGWTVGGTRVVPDEESMIQAVALQWADGGMDVVIAAGGTGVAPRDVTPESLKPLLDKELPGFGELMRAEGLKKTPKAALSRSFGGVRGRCVLLALPGSPAGATESLAAVADLLPAVLSLLKEGVCA